MSSWKRSRKYSRISFTEMARARRREESFRHSSSSRAVQPTVQKTHTFIMPPAPNSWACNCPTVHPRNKKRCGVCYAWQGGTRFSAATCSSQSSAAKTGNFVVRGKLDSSNNVGEEIDQSDDGHSGEDENKASAVLYFRCYVSIC
jgi:hypothetical protein